MLSIELGLQFDQQKIAANPEQAMKKAFQKMDKDNSHLATWDRRNGGMDRWPPGIETKPGESKR